MGEIILPFAGVAIVFGLTFLLMRAMWRQMRRVNSHTAAESRRRAEEEGRSRPATERWDEAQGRYVPEEGDPNEELLRQGSRARSNPWPYDP
jgi:Na+-transporting methylmalonyl-CoA/oxaloacetate decarboxylase gamma subunit